MLKNITVLELASVLAGPSVGMFLAELGADVIKMENIHTNGDVTRIWKTPNESPGSDVSAYFSSVNWGKRSIAVDLTHPDGLAIVHRLARQSDIVLASYKPGDAEKLKVDAVTLRSLNPALIYASITGYGPDNPRAGFDAIIQAESGFTYMNGEPDGPPTKMPVALMDVLAAHQVKEAILLALLHRERTGTGQTIDASLIRSGIASLVNQAANWLVGGVIPQRLGSDHPNIVPYGTIFTTRDGKNIVLAVGTERQFSGLCRVLGRPELAQDSRFATNVDRIRYKTELKRILQELIAVFNRDEILDLLAEHSIPAGGVLNVQEVFETPEGRDMLLEGEYRDEVDDQGNGDGTTDSPRSMRGVRSVAFGSDRLERNSAMLPPPHYAAHTRRLLKERLGLSEAEIESLIDQGVIACR